MVAAHTIDVHPSNLEQLHAWDGDEGAYWAARADYFERSVAPFADALLDAAAIQPTDRVLDIGCGSGGTTREAARRAPAGQVLGVDLSSAMLEVGRRAAVRERLTAVRFVQCDAQVHPFGSAAFDVAISCTGAMFFADPVAAFRNVARALVVGGRLALVVWQAPERNEWISEIGTAFAAGRRLPLPPPGARGPFALADADHARAVLERAGFAQVDLRPVSAPMWFGRDPDDAVAFIRGVAGWMLDGLDEQARARALDVLRRSAEAHRTAEGVEFGGATWLVTARRPG